MARASCGILFLAFSSWGAIVLVNLAAIPLFVRYLGVEGYGIYLLLTGLFGYFGLLDFGLSDSVVKFVAHHQELGDHKSIAEAVNAALLVQVMGGAVGVSVLCAFNQQIIKALHVSPALARVASLALYVSAAGFFCKMLLNTFNAALRGLQRFDILAKTTARRFRWRPPSRPFWSSSPEADYWKSSWLRL